MRRILFLILAGLISFASLSQDIDKVKLDAYFDTLAKHNKFMGSVALSRNNELIYAKSVGFADIDHKIKANENSKYRIGSISKTFTAVLIFKAIEENKLNLEQTIYKFFPTIKNADKIKITHLLYHRSGIHNFTDDSLYLTWNTRPKTEQEMLSIIAKTGSDFAPDAKTDYSNSNYVLLSYILEKIYQKPYSKILEEKIINPAGLKNTYYGGKIDVKNHECNSYKYSDDWKIESETDMSVPLGAGGIVSTPVDLNLFSDALFNGKLVSINSLMQMQTIKERFGMGLVQMPFYYKIGYGHTGGIDGFASMFTYFPDSKVSFAYTANGINYSGNDIAIIVLSAVYAKPYEIPEFYDVADKDLDKYVGVYSSKQFPVKIIITKVNKQLLGQFAGQPASPLEAIAKNKFKFIQMNNAILEFNIKDKILMFKQDVRVINLVKE